MAGASHGDQRPGEHVLENPDTVTGEKQAKGAAAFLERMVPLGKAANLLGIDSRTLRRWLEDERGLALPRLGRGASPLVRVADVQAVIASRQGIQKYTPRPTPPAAAEAGGLV